jgi:hypothetical protein
MIKRSIITFLILFVVYNIIVTKKPNIGASQHQWQRNVIKAQKYIYNDGQTFQNVIVGSSLSARFLMDSLPEFYNLSFDGKSIYDGLDIIKNTKTLPKNVFIETNVILRDQSPDFTNSLFSPILFFLNEHLVALRADKQPIGIFIWTFKDIKNVILKKLNFTNDNQSINKQDVHNKQADNEVLFTKMLDMQIANYSKPPETLDVQNKLALLTTYINFLRTNHVNVYLFEMPIHPAIFELPQASIVRKEINKIFDKNRVTFLSNDTTAYHTTDGLHLDQAEALNYTIFFKQEFYKHH